LQWGRLSGAAARRRQPWGEHLLELTHVRLGLAAAPIQRKHPLARLGRAIEAGHQPEMMQEELVRAMFQVMACFNSECMGIQAAPSGV